MVRARPKQRPKQWSSGSRRAGSAAIRRRRAASFRRTPLDEVILHLRHLQSAVIVAIAALRRQNCELDEDIARLLQRCVCDLLDDQLKKLEAAHRPRVARVRGV